MFQLTLALLLFLVPLAYSPGPGNMFMAASGARFGFRKTLPFNAGYHVATFGVTLAIGTGILTVFEESSAVFQALKIFGALYVLWLAYKMFRRGALPAEQNAGEGPESGASGLRAVDGAILLLLNPKAYVIIALMFSQLLHRFDAVLPWPVLWMTIVFTLNNIVVFVVWALAGDVIARRFRSPDTALRLNAVFAALLAGVGLWMLLF